MEMMTSHDKGNLILANLKRHGGLSTPDLALNTGLAAEEVSKLIFYLKKDHLVDTQQVMDGRTGHQLIRHVLTTQGKRLAPHLPRYDLPPKSPREKFKAKNPVMNGLKHLNGINGKVNLSKPLSGARGKIYATLTRAMKVREISDASNLEIPTVQFTLRELERMGAVTWVYAKREQQYGRPEKIWTRNTQITLTTEFDSPPPAEPITLAQRLANLSNLSEKFNTTEEHDDDMAVVGPVESAPPVTETPPPLMPSTDKISEVFNQILSCVAVLEQEINRLKQFESVILNASQSKQTNH